MELTSQQEDLILEQARERHFEENRKHEIAVEERHNIDEQKEAQADLIRKDVNSDNVYNYVEEK